jgi:hypothetical protein
MRRWREVRDVFQKLRKQYRTDVVMEFICTNYFFENNSGVYWALKNVDKDPVQNPSKLYNQVMEEGFHL